MMKKLAHATTIAELAAAVDGVVEGDETLEITRAVHPDDAETASDLAIAMTPAILETLGRSAASVALVHQSATLPANVTTAIRVAKAARAMAGLTGFLDQPRWHAAGIHPSAVIDPSAAIGAGATIGPHCVVGPDAAIGAGATLYAQVTLGARGVIGEDCHIHPGVRIGDDCEIGARTIIHSNSVIGADGFSYTAAGRGSVEAAKGGATQVGQHSETRAANTHLLRIGSLGRVVIGCDCEIGALTAIDRATLRDTMIGDGTKLDNLVQIGHNAVLGQNIMVCGQSGIAGSTVIGDRAVLGAQSGAADNIRIGEDAVIMAKTGIAGNVPPGTVLFGTPGLPREKTVAQYMAVSRLPRLLPQMAERLAKLEQLVAALAPALDNGGQKS